MDMGSKAPALLLAGRANPCSQTTASRGMSQVFATRSQFTFGLDALDATKNSGDIPDGQFFSWLGQFQWARRLNLLDAQILSRFDIQLTNASLLGLEQFGMGGATLLTTYTIAGEFAIHQPAADSSADRAWAILDAIGTIVGANWTVAGNTLNADLSTFTIEETVFAESGRRVDVEFTITIEDTSG